MSPRTRGLAVALAAALLLPACATVTETVDDAGEAVDEGLQRLEWCTAAFRLGTAVENRDLEAGRAALDDLRASAPEELADELQVITEAVEAAEQGDLERIEGEEVRAAGEEVRATAQAQCDPTTRPE